MIGAIKRSENVTVTASSPVATLVGYSTVLRQISSGQGHFMMEIEGYNTMSQTETEKVISSIRGY